MSVPFNARWGLLVVYAEIEGPSGMGIVRLALDTGAAKTLISPRALAEVGYEAGAEGRTTDVTTASGIEHVPLLSIRRIRALGQERLDLAVVCHALPPTARLDGLLGFDFLRGYVLTVDFIEGRIDLSVPSPPAR